MHELLTCATQQDVNNDLIQVDLRSFVASSSLLLTVVFLGSKDRLVSIIRNFFGIECCLGDLKWLAFDSVMLNQ